MRSHYLIVFSKNILGKIIQCICLYSISLNTKYSHVLLSGQPYPQVSYCSLCLETIQNTWTSSNIVQQGRIDQPWMNWDKGSLWSSERHYHLSLCHWMPSMLKVQCDLFSFTIFIIYFSSKLMYGERACNCGAVSNPLPLTKFACI